MRAVRRLLGSVVALAMAAVLLALALAWQAGYRAYIVHTGSMIPTLRPGEAVLDRPVRGPVHRGEIITFRYDSGADQVVTHRVFSDVNGVIRTKGDANPTKDPWTLQPAQVVGTPQVVVPGGGYALVYLGQPTGAASLVLSVAAIWLLWGLCFPDESEAAEAAPKPRRSRRAGPAGPASSTWWPAPETGRQSAERRAAQVRPAGRPGSATAGMQVLFGAVHHEPVRHHEPARPVPEWTHLD